MWKIKQEKAIDFLLLECLRGHSAPITCLTSSRSYSVLVSGSKVKEYIESRASINTLTSAVGQNGYYLGSESSRIRPDIKRSRRTRRYRQRQ